LNAGKILGGFRYDISGTQASSYKHFLGLPEHLKRVPGRIFRILSNFIEASKKFKINYNKRSTDLIIWSFKKCPSRDTILLSICCKPGSLNLYCPVQQFT
jgi:hypothetical protein